jgi:hypothetical protein
MKAPGGFENSARCVVVRVAPMQRLALVATENLRHRVDFIESRDQRSDRPFAAGVERRLAPSNRSTPTTPVGRLIAGQPAF